MLSAELYNYLASIITTRGTLYPSSCHQVLPSGFKPEHLKCHLTAMQVAVELGHPAVVGIQFLDLHGKLFPWPHMVNWRPGGLVDYSPPPDQRRLGFIETGWAEFAQWRDIIGAYLDRGAFVDKPIWGDRFADLISQQFLVQLRTRAAQSGS